MTKTEFLDFLTENAENIYAKEIKNDNECKWFLEEDTYYYDQGLKAYRKCYNICDEEDWEDVENVEVYNLTSKNLGLEDIIDNKEYGDKNFILVITTKLQVHYEEYDEIYEKYICTGLEQLIKTVATKCNCTGNYASEIYTIDLTNKKTIQIIQ